MRQNPATRRSLSAALIAVLLGSTGATIAASGTRAATSTAGGALVTAFSTAGSPVASSEARGRPPAQVPSEVRDAFYGIVGRDLAVQVRSARLLARRGERDAIPYLVDALRYRDFRTGELLEALRTLAGVDLGVDYRPWAEWMVNEGILAAPGYRRWKADFLARLDPRFGDFLDPERPTTIAYEEIQWGGVRAEGIPSLDRPAVVAAAVADYLDDDELVFGAVAPVESATGEPTLVARAYPLRILDWHEMTNDELGGTPVALSYCTLCGSGILFDRRLGDRTFTFATSGLLYRSNKLMFDRETESLWSNLTGEPVIGPLVGEGLRLEVLPLVVTTWSQWRRLHPHTSVLSLDTGYERDYRPGAPYGEYFASPATMFPVGPRDERLPDKAWVYGLRIGGAAAAFALEAVQRAGVVNAAVGRRNVVLVGAGGRAVRAYERDGERFAGEVGGAPGGWLQDAAGGRWRITDPALVEDGGGRRLRRLPGHLAYWFGWYAFFPETELWTGERRP